MRSKAVKRRRRRRRIDPVPWLWAAVAVNLVAGFALSPLTAVTRLRVVGAAEADQAWIEERAQRLHRVPWPQTNPSHLAGVLAGLPDVAQARFESNVFGRGVARLELRRPVAVLDPEARILLDERGQVYATRRALPEGLPQIRLPKGTLAPTYTLSAAVETQRLAQLALDLAAQLPNLRPDVEVDGRGVLSLRVERGGVVVLGSSEGLSHKVSRLKVVLDQAPGVLETVERLDLTAPDNPVVVPRP